MTSSIAGLGVVQTLRDFAAERAATRAPEQPAPWAFNASASSAPMPSIRAAASPLPSFASFSALSSLPADFAPASIPMKAFDSGGAVPFGKATLTANFWPTLAAVKPFDTGATAFVSPAFKLADTTVFTPTPYSTNDISQFSGTIDRMANGVKVAVIGDFIGNVQRGAAAVGKFLANPIGTIRDAVVTPANAGRVRKVYQQVVPRTPAASSANSFGSASLASALFGSASSVVPASAALLRLPTGLELSKSGSKSATHSPLFAVGGNQAATTPVARNLSAPVFYAKLDRSDRLMPEEVQHSKLIGQGYEVVGTVDYKTYPTFSEAVGRLVNWFLGTQRGETGTDTLAKIDFQEVVAEMLQRGKAVSTFNAPERDPGPLAEFLDNDVDVVLNQIHQGVDEKGPYTQFIGTLYQRR